jgi:hypothetical protein
METVRVRRAERVRLTYFTDMLFRSGHPGQADETAAKTEVGPILFRALANGNLSDADKTYVAQLVSHQSGISQADAEKRIDDVMAQAKAAAQQAADKAKQLRERWRYRPRCGPSSDF